MKMSEQLKKDLEGKEKELHERQQSVSHLRGAPGFIRCQERLIFYFS